MTPCIPRCGSLSLFFFTSLSFSPTVLDSSLSRRSHSLREQHFAFFPYFSSFLLQKPLGIHSRDDARIASVVNIKQHATGVRVLSLRVLFAPMRAADSRKCRTMRKKDLSSDRDGDRHEPAVFPRSLLLAHSILVFFSSSPRGDLRSIARLRTITQRKITCYFSHSLRMLASSIHVMSTRFDSCSSSRAVNFTLELTRG